MLSTSVSNRFKVILNFWFGNRKDADYGNSKEFYWASTPTIDQQIKENFEDDYKKARDGEYDNWKETGPYETLALILLLDQVPRNIFRNLIETYATDSKALSVAKFAVAAGYDKNLRLPIEKQFMYMPYMHSENLEDQKEGLQLFGLLEPYLGPNAYTQKYFQIISRFGRFPHRNDILGRKSTPEEIEYLKVNVR